MADEKKKKMPLAVKFHLTMVLPLFLISCLVTYVTYLGLEKNASELTFALKIQAKAKEILPLLLTQDDASKAMLINPDKLDEFSGKKIEAYDAHKEILVALEKEAHSDEVKQIIGQLFKIDGEKLRPLDTKILEQTFEDIDLARKTYFDEYDPARQEYESLIRKLGKIGAENADTAAIEMARKNQLSLLQIAAALCLGIIVVIATILILSRQVEQSEANMVSLLAGLTEGLFFFDEQGNIASERSQALQKILPGSGGVNTIMDFAEKFTKITSKNVEACLKLLWAEEDDGFFSDFSTSVTMLPNEVKVDVEGKERDIHFEYRPLYSQDEKLDKVIVIVSDVTEKLRNEREARTQAERVRKVTKAVANIESFKGFMNESIKLFISADKQFSLTDESQLQLPQLKRDLHTIKGSIGTYEFNAIAKKVHELEDMIGDAEPGDLLGKCKDLWEEIKDQWKFETSDIEQVLGLKSKQDKISVDKAKISAIFRYAKTQNDNQLMDLTHGLTRYALPTLLNKYVNYLDKLASRRDDKQVRVEFVEDSNEISYGEIQDMDTALIHIFRNCLDHGIEEIKDRESCGKSPSGVIQVAAYRKADNALHFIIKDDGGGINGDKLAQKAIESGLWTEEKAKSATDQDKHNLIFAPNLSSKDEVTDVSGRGVGMDAVRTYLESKGGGITVYSKLGQGTQFEIDLPGEQNSALKAA